MIFDERDASSDGRGGVLYNDVIWDRLYMTSLHIHIFFRSGHTYIHDVIQSYVHPYDQMLSHDVICFIHDICVMFFFPLFLIYINLIFS